MATRGSLSVEVDVVSDSDAFWGVLGDPSQYPIATPEYYKSVQLVHGSNIGPGAVVRVTYGKDHPVEVLEERMESVGDRTFSYSYVKGMENLFKSLRGTFWVIPKVQGSIVKFSLVFEKVSPEVADPIDIKEFKVKTFVGTDAYLLNNQRFDSN